MNIVRLKLCGGIVIAVAALSATAQTDYVNWSTFGPAGTPVASPSSIPSVDSSTTVTVADTGGFAVTQEGNGFTGDFTPGEYILVSPNDDGATISFSSPIDGLDLPLEAADTGSFTYAVSAYDFSGTFLGTISGSSVNEGLQNGSELQVPVNYADVGHVVISTVDVGDDGFGVGTIGLDTLAVPEPAPLALAGLGAVVLLFRKRP